MKIRVPLPDLSSARITVPGYVFGDWFVHRAFGSDSDADEWTVSHLETGLAIPKQLYSSDAPTTEFEAICIAQELDAAGYTFDNRDHDGRHIVMAIIGAAFAEED